MVSLRTLEESYPTQWGWCLAEVSKAEGPAEGSLAPSSRLSGWRVCLLLSKTGSQKHVGRNGKLFCRQLHLGGTHRLATPEGPVGEKFN